MAANHVVEELRRQLYSGAGSLVWVGCGYVGLSAMLTYASEGVRVWGIDINERAVAQINAGESPVPGLEDWVGVKLRDVSHLVRATTSWDDVPWSTVKGIFVSVNTERAGRPDLKPLAAVAVSLRAVAARWTDADRPAVFIESTIPLNALSEIDVAPFPLVVSPRRDWFVTKDQNLRTLARVYGTATPAAEITAEAILGIVTAHLQRASSPKTAALVKPVENAYQHAQMMWWSELSLAYPDIDVDELAALASGHWRIRHKWWPGMIGTGGYCVPVAGQYLLEGTHRKDLLSMVTQAADTDRALRAITATRLSGCGRVLILGVAYKGGLHVTAQSPAIDVACRLRDNDHCQVTISDPYVDATAVARETGCAVVPLDEACAGTYDGILIATDHPEFRRIPPVTIPLMLKGSRGGGLILDEHAIWEKHRDLLTAAGILYIRRGWWSPDWDNGHAAPVAPRRSKAESARAPKGVLTGSAKAPRRNKPVAAALNAAAPGRWRAARSTRQRPL